MMEVRRQRFLAEINVIPLVDVVLVLLVIFMVTAPMLYRGLDIQLPRTASNTIKPEQRVVVTIERNQKIYVDKDLVPVMQLETRFETIRRDKPTVSVYLRADRNVSYGVVVQVMDAIKKAGIDTLGMVTEPVSQEQVH